MGKATPTRHQQQALPTYLPCWRARQYEFSNVSVSHNPHLQHVGSIPLTEIDVKNKWVTIGREVTPTQVQHGPVNFPCLGANQAIRMFLISQYSFQCLTGPTTR